MKKSILAIAVASMVASTAAVAEPTVYGNVHLSIQSFDKDDGTGAGTDGNLGMSSNTSSLGVKGSEDLGDGLKAIYKVEFQVDAADGSQTAAPVTQRDTFAGLKGGFGTVKIGLMATNYKQTGPKVDSLWRTPAEGRGFISTQSKLQAGSGKVNSGRQANTLQYVSPSMGGFSLVANTSFTDSDDETSGIGARWSNKAFLVFVDYIDGQVQATSISTNATESSMKVGGKFSAKSFFIGGQFEDTEDATAFNYVHLNGGFLINKNNIITATYGTKEHINDDAQDTTGMALAYDHKMSKMTDVYVAYVDRSSDSAALEDSAFSLGFRKKF